MKNITSSCSSPYFWAILTVSVLFTLCTSGVLSKPAASTVEETDVVSAIINALDKQKDMWRTISYVNDSRAQLLTELRTTDSAGKKQSYTFFAPQSSAFLHQLPQDAPDPFVLDDDFRLKVLLRHFARRRISPDELGKVDLLFMADSTSTALSRSLEDNTKWTINDAVIQEETFTQLAGDHGVLYVVDRVFIDGSEVEEVFAKHKSSFGTGVFGVPFPGDAAVVVESSDSVASKRSTKEPEKSETAEPLGIHDTPLAPPPILGGFSEAGSGDEDVKEMAQFATTALSQQVVANTAAAASSASPSLVLVKVVKAEKQVVAGINFKLTLQLKTEAANEDVFVCDVVVFDQPWTSTRQVTSSNCSPSLLTIAAVKVN